MNDQVIKLSSIKNEQVYDILKRFLHGVAEFRSINLDHTEYLALKCLVMFDPGASCCPLSTVRLNSEFFLHRSDWYKQSKVHWRNTGEHRIGPCRISDVVHVECRTGKVFATTAEITGNQGARQRCQTIAHSHRFGNVRWIIARRLSLGRDALRSTEHNQLGVQSGRSRAGLHNQISKQHKLAEIHHRPTRAELYCSTSQTCAALAIFCFCCLNQAM